MNCDVYEQYTVGTVCMMCDANVSKTLPRKLMTRMLSILMPTACLQYCSGKIMTQDFFSFASSYDIMQTVRYAVIDCR